MAVKLTEATTDDRVPVEDLWTGLCGKLFGDKGYISKTLQDKLLSQWLELITKIKKNMKASVLPTFDWVLLRKRVIIENVIDQFKNISQIKPTRHRSVDDFLLNLVAGLTAYSLQSKEPSIDMHFSGVTVV